MAKLARSQTICTSFSEKPKTPKISKKAEKRRQRKLKEPTIAVTKEDVQQETEESIYTEVTTFGTQEDDSKSRDSRASTAFHP